MKKIKRKKPASINSVPIKPRVDTGGPASPTVTQVNMGKTWLDECAFLAMQAIILGSYNDEGVERKHIAVEAYEMAYEMLQLKRGFEAAMQKLGA